MSGSGKDKIIFGPGYPIIEVFADKEGNNETSATKQVNSSRSSYYKDTNGTDNHVMEDWSWHYATSQPEDGGVRPGLIGISMPIKYQKVILAKFHRILLENAFVESNKDKYASLTRREKEVIVMLASGRNNPEIAQKLSISRRTVEQHRKNINRKLNIKSLISLYRFAQAFDMV